MIRIKDPSQCCGCTACASICAHHAITMEADALGFLYPKVDENKCVECGLCEKVCQFNDNYERSHNLSAPIVYAARHKEMNEIMKSRSGAAFAALSDYILDLGGVVYGAGYSDHFRVVHKRASTRKERDEFRGSKYVQSDLTGVFPQIMEDLKNGRTVLFSGTPCQTSGLNAFVANKYRNNLYLVDIVCHGVPGPYIWRDYIAYLEKKQKKVITQLSFRDKENFGWRAHIETFFFGKRVQSRESYTKLFYRHIMFRHSCGVCHFSNLKRPSDITLADFWGWEKNVPDMNKDDKGINLILLNTEKGKELFNKISDKLVISPVNVENCLQPNLQHPSVVSPQRIQFEEDYMRNGFDCVIKRYGDVGWRNTLRAYKKKIKSLLPFK